MWRPNHQVAGIPGSWRRQRRQSPVSGHSLWTLGRWLANSHINNESLETIGSLSPSRTISQDPEDWSLSPPHCSATGVVLKDCATEHSSEVLLAADILAFRASQSSFKTVPSTTKSPFQDRYPFFSKEENVPKISRPQEAWHSHIFGPKDEKTEYRSHRTYSL